jgi:subfamily B ATP-binding cassette protein MsbA
MIASKPAAEIGALALLRRLFTEHARRHFWAYVSAAALMAIGAAATAVSAWLLKPIVNGMVGNGGDFKELRALSWAVFGLFSLRGLATFGSLALLSRAGNNIVAAIQRQLFDGLLKQDMRFYHDRHSAEFMTRLSLSANGMRDAMQMTITSISRDALTAIGLVTVMAVQDPLLTVLALAGLPIAALTLGRLIVKIRKFSRRSFDGSTRIVETLQEAVLGARIVKSFNLEDTMRARMASAVREVERSANRISITAAISNPISDVLAGFAIGAVIFYGSWRVTIHHADPGSLFSFIAALMLAYEPLKRLGRSNLDIQNGLVGARMIYDVIDRPTAEAQPEGLPKLAVSGGRIAFEHVRFGYRADEPVLKDVDFVAEPGKTTALVGPSGGGKSTIIGMIQRFYAADAGRIVIDGQAIMDVDLASLRASIAFVSQDVFLFRGTIRDNIALGRPGATDEEITAAAVKAHAHDFISAFANGYHTNVGEQGAQLSGGQRARIAIARAILKDAPILLLDEPTAALDSESEREIQKALDDLRVGRTTLVVAHRLQTIINADLICVVDGGVIAESGIHADLIARRGVYRDFFSMQFGDVAHGEKYSRERA